jgi:hypothetical protein
MRNLVGQLDKLRAAEQEISLKASRDVPSLLTTYYSLLTTHYLRLTTKPRRALYSLLTTHYVLLTTYDSRLTTYYSLPTRQAATCPLTPSCASAS